MNKINFHKLGPAVLAALLVTPFAANAESDFESTTGAGNLTATARVDFQITIPKFLFLQVGTLGAAIDLIDFDVPALDVGNAVPVAGTGGNVGAGAVTATVRGNGGNISLVATTGGALSNGAGGQVNWSEILSATNNAGLTPPVLANGASAPVVLNAANNIVNQTATWTYTYANSAVVPAGTYGGVNLNNGRVTYTVTFL